MLRVAIESDGASDITSARIRIPKTGTMTKEPGIDGCQRRGNMGNSEYVGTETAMTTSAFASAPPLIIPMRYMDNTRNDATGIARPADENGSPGSIIYCAVNSTAARARGGMARTPDMRSERMYDRMMADPNATETEVDTALASRVRIAWAEIPTMPRTAQCTSDAVLVRASDRDADDSTARDTIRNRGPDNSLHIMRSMPCLVYYSVSIY